MRPALALTFLCVLAPTAAALLPATLPCPAGGCEIPNAGFEDCPGCASEAGAIPLAWERYVFPGQCLGEGLSWSTEQARTGLASVRIEDTSTGCTGLVSESVPIVPGLPYTVSMWAKAAAGTPQVGVFIAYYTNADDPYRAYAAKIPFAGHPGTDWTEIGGTTQQVTGAAHVRLWVYAPMRAAGVTYVDDLTLRSGI